MGWEQAEAINVCLALLWLGAAIVFARLNRPEDQYQLRRVPRAACAFFGGFALIVYVLAALSGQLDVMLFHSLLFSVLIVGMVAFLSALIVDALAILVGAKRTPGWLAAGILIAVIVTYGWLFMLGAALWGAGLSLQSPVFFTPGLIAAAAGLVWWSELPRPESNETAVFD